MNGPTTAREALIAEALGEVALLLDRVEALTSSMEVGRMALANARAELSAGLNAFETRMESVTDQAQTRAIEHIVRRTGEATRLSIEVQTRAMSEAARQAFTAQLDSTLARLASSVQHLIQRVDRPWELWLTHVATAVASAILTWFVASLLAFR
jgi:hypothetical protein